MQSVNLSTSAGSSPNRSSTGDMVSSFGVGALSTYLTSLLSSSSCAALPFRPFASASGRSWMGIRGVIVNRRWYGPGGPLLV